MKVTREETWTTALASLLVCRSYVTSLVEPIEVNFDLQITLDRKTPKFCLYFYASVKLFFLRKKQIIVK